MAAYAEGLNVLAKADIGSEDHAGRRRDGTAAPPRVLPVRPRPRRGHRGVAPRQRGRQLAARPHRRRARRPTRSSTAYAGSVSRLRRGALDDRTPPSTRACRRPCCRRRCTSGSARAAAPMSPTRCCRRCAPGSAATSSDGERRPIERRAPVHRRRSHQPRPADALVLFGATGDLAKRKLFPALYHLERRGELNVPVIGVARSDWTDERSASTRASRSSSRRRPATTAVIKRADASGST